MLNPAFQQKDSHLRSQDDWHRSWRSRTLTPSSMYVEATIKYCLGLASQALHWNIPPHLNVLCCIATSIICLTCKDGINEVVWISRIKNGAWFNKQLCKFFIASTLNRTIHLSCRTQFMRARDWLVKVIASPYICPSELAALSGNGGESSLPVQRLCYLMTFLRFATAQSNSL